MIVTEMDDCAAARKAGACQPQTTTSSRSDKDAGIEAPGRHRGIALEQQAIAPCGLVMRRFIRAEAQRLSREQNSQQDRGERQHREPGDSNAQRVEVTTEKIRLSQKIAAAT